MNNNDMYPPMVFSDNSLYKFLIMMINNHLFKRNKLSIVKAMDILCGTDMAKNILTEQLFTKKMTEDEFNRIVTSPTPKHPEVFFQAWNVIQENVTLSAECPFMLENMKLFYQEEFSNVVNLIMLREDSFEDKSYRHFKIVHIDGSVKIMLIDEKTLYFKITGDEDNFRELKLSDFKLDKDDRWKIINLLGYLAVDKIQDALQYEHLLGEQFFEQANIKFYKNVLISEIDFKEYEKEGINYATL